MAEVAGERGEVGGVGLEAAVRAAQALGPARIDGDVPEFAGRVVVSANDLAVHDDSGADAVRHGDVDEVARGVAAALAEPHLRERAGDRRVLDVDGEARRAGQIVADVDVAPPELRRVEHSSGGLFDHAGDDEPDAVALSRRAMGFEEPSDALGEVRGEALGVDDGVERVAGDGGAAEIGQLRKVRLNRTSTATTRRSCVRT